MGGGGECMGGPSALGRGSGMVGGAVDLCRLLDLTLDGVLLSATIYPTPWNQTRDVAEGQSI